MTNSFVAVYEGGVLRPTVPLPFVEGARVEVVILNGAASGPAGSPAEILASIAALPTLGGDPNTSKEHDQVLYKAGS
jgi:predicted DNA-binding antitoxin AbrB/MazE fold protein